MAEGFWNPRRLVGVGAVVLFGGVLLSRIATQTDADAERAELLESIPEPPVSEVDAVPAPPRPLPAQQWLTRQGPDKAGVESWGGALMSVDKWVGPDDKPHRSSVGIKCTAAETTVTFSPYASLTQGDSVDVSVQLDDGPARELSLARGERDNLEFPEPKAFAVELQGAKRMSLAFTPEGGLPQTVHYTLHVTGRPLDDMATGCAW